LHDLRVMRQPRSRPPGRPRLVTLSSNRQGVIPKQLCEELDLQAGDLLAGTIDGGRVVFTPQSLVDRPIKAALQDVGSTLPLSPSPRVSLRHGTRR